MQNLFSGELPQNQNQGQPPPRAPPPPHISFVDRYRLTNIICIYDAMIYMTWCREMFLFLLILCDIFFFSSYFWNPVFKVCIAWNISFLDKTVLVPSVWFSWIIISLPISQWAGPGRKESMDCRIEFTASLENYQPY